MSSEEKERDPTTAENESKSSASEEEMTTELSLKDLKALQDENDLDLSMRQLTSIPVKALSKIPRAIHLDFSNNLIATVPPDFCFLTHITKLDLSNNHIVHLPEEFGKLINLAHLDLYKNEIEELPLSFGELESLRWLDLKGNPLEQELSKAAGDCLNEKGCKQAALNVVRLMRDRAAKQQRLLDKQKIATKQPKDSDTVNHGLTTQKEKPKKKKNKHRDSVNEQPGPVAERIQQNGPQVVSEKQQKQTNHETERNEKRSTSSVMTFLWRIFVVLFVFSLILSGFIVITVVSNCVGDSRYWFSSSKPFCKDLRTVMTKHSLPPTTAGNFFLAIASLLKSYAELGYETWNDIQQQNFIAVVRDNIHSLYMKLVSEALLVQGYVIHKSEDLMAFYETYAASTVDNALRSIWLLIRIFGLMLADLMMFIADKGLLFISSVVETIFTYAHRGDQVAEMLQQWWNRMK